MAETVAEGSLDGLWRAYEHIPKKGPVRWVLSQKTLDAIDAEQDANYRRQGIHRASPIPPDTPVTLFSLPVRIDESVEGIAYEVPE